MTTSIDLDAYLDRIHWTGGTAPGFETLARLLDAHMTYIPFENLDVLLHRPIRLDLDSLQNKLVRARRGGYCFEHATLFAAVLEALGFQPIRHSARVTLIVPRSASPRGHMFLTTALPEGVFVLDPGFGAQAARMPVPLVDPESVQTERVTHWMVRDGGAWILRTRRDKMLVDAWASTLEEEYSVDFEMASHFMASHPMSGFVNRLMMSAFTADGRVTVMNRDLTIWRGEQAETRQIADRAELRALLATYFGFNLPEVERIRIPLVPEWD